MSGSLNKLSPSALDAIYDAALVITAELSLPIVLNRIVALARDLVQARYAALGIPDPSGEHLVQFITSGISDEDQHKIEHLPTGKGVLGLLLSVDAKPLRMNDISEHPEAVGFPGNHPHMTGFLGVPIQSRGELLGNLYLTDKENGEAFTKQDETLIMMLASYAAVAIENARLYQQVQRIAVLEERDRIGMDLHDGIIQSIYAVGLNLEHVGFLMDENIATAHDQLNEAIGGLNTIIKDIRNYILDLRPERFEGTDLSAALARLTRAFRANTLADVSLDYDQTLNTRLTESVALAAFHITQETLANAAKHAAATRLDISFKLQDDEIVIGVRDNGRGFILSEAAQSLGHGLSNIDLRARSVGGYVEVVSAPGKGTSVTAYLPINGHRR